MTKLFYRDRTAIVRHINNVFKDNELDKNEALSDKTQKWNKLQKRYLQTIVLIVQFN